jgi:hypothetical protein
MTTIQTQAIVILNYDNGFRWIQDINSAFYRHQINDHVSGHALAPQKPNIGASQELMNRYEIDYKKWMDKDGLAKSIIYETLSQDYRATFEWDKTAKQNMDLIKLKVMDYSKQAIRNIKRTLESTKQGSMEPINKFLNRWNTELSKLRDAGEI